jgi:hypothetical protein
MGLKSDAFGAASIIYLRDIIRFQYLPYSTNTSIKKFCEAFNIPVLGNSRKYVMAIQLDIPRKETHSFRIKLTHQIFFPD